MGIIDYIRGQVKSHGLTLKNLSEKTSLDTAYLSRVFNGHIAPSSKIIDRLLKVVNIDIEKTVSKNHFVFSLIGEVHDLNGQFSEKEPKEISLFPEGTIFAVLIKAPSFVKGIHFPNGYFMFFSKDEKVKSGDNAFVVYKNSNKTQKIIRKILFKGSKAILRSPFPESVDIVIPRKSIIEMHKLIRMGRPF